MKILVISYANPAETNGSWLDYDFYSDKGNPQPTGNWAMREEDLYIEVAFTWKAWFKTKTVTKYLHSDSIKLQEELKYFSCHKKNNTSVLDYDLN